MLFATEPDAAAIGAFLQILFWVTGSVGAILVAVAAVKSAFFKKTTPESEYLTRGEFDKQLNRLEDEIKDIRKKFHDLRNSLHAINLRIVWMSGIMVNIQHKVDPTAVVQPMPNISEQDEA